MTGSPDDPVDPAEPIDLSEFDRAPGASPNGGFNLTTDGERCGAKNRQGKPCKRHPSHGTKRCHLHGGSSPQAIAKAARDKHQREVIEQVNKAIVKFDIEPVENPLTALKELAGEILKWKEILLDKVQLLDKIRYSTEFNEQVRGEVLLYERAVDRAIQVLATIARLNIDERLAAVTESQAKMIEDALFSAFDAAGIPITEPDQREAVAVAFGRHLAIVG
jgi:hypothetical protein